MKHLSKWDREVAEEWMKEFNITPAGLTYDQPVGEGCECKEEVPFGLASRWADLRRPRIDVVWRTAGVTWVVEFKPRATVHAIGQVIVYGVLFAREWKEEWPVRMMVVAFEADKDTQFLADHFGVSLTVLKGKKASTGGGP